MLRLQVLGPIAASIGGRPVDVRGANQRRLLAMLVAADKQVVSTERLVDQMWAGLPPETAIRTFRTYVARLRRSLEAAGAPDGAQLVVTDAPGYRLGADVSADAVLFADAVDRASERLTAGEPSAAWTEVDEALGLWTGNAFDEFADEEWASAAAIRLEELRLVARELRIESQMERGRHVEAISEIEQFVTEHPLRETPRRHLMVALYRSGRQAEALRASRAFARYLGDETGLEPSAAITDVEAMILAEDPRLDAAPRGQRLRGYLLEEPLATSDQGTVFRARQPSIDRDVAVTVILPELADDSRFVRRFETRASAVASVEHPSVAPIYDYWREPGGAYLVSRHYADGTLADRLLASSLPADAAWTLVRQVVEALWAAHWRGVPHGNVRPSAIWIDERGAPILGGFDMTSPDIDHGADLRALADCVEAVLDVVATDVDSATAAHCRTRLVRLLDRLREPSDGDVAVALDLLLDADAQDRASAREPGDAEPTRQVVGPNPFRGLGAFSEADAPLFFGRTEIVDELVDVVLRRRVAALVGPSGSGKSSVVRAGLLPRFRVAGAYVTTMVPGSRPLDELEIALTRLAPAPISGLASDLADSAVDGGERLADELRSIVERPDDVLLLVIDQFEELFTFADPDERDRFLQLVAECVEHPSIDLRIVATCRADFVGRLLDHTIAGPLFRERTVLVTPLSSEDLYEAIIGPAEHAGVAVEPGLVAQIVGDGTGSPGSLPMVQYVLTELFNAAAANDGVMTSADYRRLGGVTGALAQRADEVYGALSVPEGDAARRLFTRLVTHADNAPPTRRRVRRTELANVGDVVIDAFGSARLLSFDRDPSTREPTVEVSHEALIQRWPRLAAWISEEADGLRILGHLTSASAAWTDSGADPSLLDRGTRLGEAERWAESHPEALTPTETAFLTAGVVAREQEALRERRRVTRLRTLSIGLAVFLVVALIAATLAVSARRRADDRANDADAARIDAEDARAESETVRRSAEVAALAGNARVLAGSDPIAAMSLAVEASARGSTSDPAVSAALLESLSADPRATEVRGPVASTGLVIQPDAGSHYTSVSQAGDGVTVDVFDVDTGTTRSVELDYSPAAATTDPSGTYLWAVNGQQIDLRSVDSGELLAEQPVDDFFVSSARPLTAADGLDEIASVHPGGRLVVQTLPDFEVVSSIDVAADTFAIARSGNGRVAALLDESGMLTITPLDGSTPPIVVPRPPQTDQVALDETGTLLALSDRSGPTFVIDLTEPESEPLIVDAAASTDLVFSPSGRSLAIGTADGVEVFDTATGESVTPPIEFATGVAVQFTSERTLRVFGASLGIVAVDFDAPSRVVTVTEIEGWGLAGFLAPDLTGAVGIVLDDAGAGEAWLPDPFSGDRTIRPIGPNTGARQSRPIHDGRFITADMEALTHTVSDATGVLYTIDLSADLTPGFEHFVAPRVGSGRDILVLADQGEAVRGSRVVVVDRESDDVDVRDDGVGVSAAEFADRSETTVVIGDLEGRVRWIAEDGSALPEDVVVGAAVGAVAVTDDGATTAIGDWSGTVTLVDEDRNVAAELDNDTAFPIRMAFLDDGARLLVQSEDGSIVLWDVDSASRIGTLLRTDGLRGAFEVTLDGSSVVVATDEGIAEIAVSPDRWVELACDALERRLTDAELGSIVPGVSSADDPCAGEG